MYLFISYRNEMLA